MGRTYLISFSSLANVDRDQLIEYLKQNGQIDTWEYCLPYTLFIRTPMTSKQISDLIERKYGEIRHLVVRVPKNDYWGRLPTDYWGIIDNQDE
jgi:hypothetical protein